MILAPRLKQHVFIPFQAAAAVPVPAGTGLLTNRFGNGDVVAALSLGTHTHVLSLIDFITGK